MLEFADVALWQKFFSCAPGCEEISTWLWVSIIWHKMKALSNHCPLLTILNCTVKLWLRSFHKILNSVVVWNFVMNASSWTCCHLHHLNIWNRRRVHMARNLVPFNSMPMFLWMLMIGDGQPSFWKTIGCERYWHKMKQHRAQWSNRKFSAEMAKGISGIVVDNSHGFRLVLLIKFCVPLLNS